MNEKLRRATTIILLICLLGSYVISSSAHSFNLNVEYDPCDIRWINSTQYAIEDGLNESWYLLEDDSRNSYHIDHDVKNLKYYFTANDSSVDELGLSDETINEIKNAFVYSMKKWNDIYYYSYDSNGNVTANQIINVVEGDQDDYNISIKLYNNLPCPARTIPQSNNFNPDENDDYHHHYNKWSIEVDVNCFYVHDSFYIGNKSINGTSAETVLDYKERTGQHEIGHVLGLVDIDDYCTTIDAAHHQELLMGDGDDAMTRATYKDIAGVSITRGFHTDDDHRWMIRTKENGSTYLICSLCNGIRTEFDLEDDGTYEGQVPAVYGSCNDDHSLTGGNMLLAATDGIRDFYKCLRCRYIEEAEHSHRYTECAQYNGTDHIEACVCGERGSITNSHEYGDWVYVDGNSHAKTCGDCGYQVVGAHAVKASEVLDGIGRCLYCGSLINLNDDFSQIIHKVQKVSINGSYILPSGIIVLVDEDIEAYENGTLVFYDKDDLPVKE